MTHNSRAQGITKYAGALLVATLALQLSANGREMPVGPAAEYAGWVDGHGAWMDVALFQVSTGVRMYYKVYGVFPASWDAVKQAGIYQGELAGPRGELVNPDDPSLDFYGDVYYIPHKGLQGAQLVNLVFQDGPYWNYDDVKPVPTYRELLEKAVALGDSEQLLAYADDELRLRQFATLGFIRRALDVYKDLHGDYPRSFQEFIGSGLSPVDENSINPVTGKRYEFRLAPGDITYDYQSAESTGRKSYHLLRHLNRDGSAPKHLITY